LSIRDPVDKNRNRSEDLQIVEIAGIVKIPRDILLDKVNENIQVVVDKLMIEIGKSEKKLSVFDFLWFRSILISLLVILSPEKKRIFY